MTIVALIVSPNSIFEWLRPIDEAAAFTKSLAGEIFVLKDHIHPDRRSIVLLVTLVGQMRQIVRVPVRMAGTVTLDVLVAVQKLCQVGPVRASMRHQKYNVFHLNESKEN